MNWFRVMSAGAILAFSVAVGGIQGAGEAKAYDSADLADAGECFVLYGGNCAHVEDARKWAVDVTIWKFNHNGHNDMSDAFRHCAWIGAVATRIGQMDAYTVGTIHETNGHGPEAEYKMDDWNNFIGSEIGAAAVSSGTSDQWGYVLNECHSRAKNHQLYGLNGVKGNY